MGALLRRRSVPNRVIHCSHYLITSVVDAIIFLAPISGFDQVLAEDRTVNRLEDSVLLWKSVCSNKLLANVDLVLFLNKCDILEKKLNAGVRLAKYVRSYGDRENDLETASKCSYLLVLLGVEAHLCYQTSAVSLAPSTGSTHRAHENFMDGARLLRSVDKFRMYPSARTHLYCRIQQQRPESWPVVCR